MFTAPQFEETLNSPVLSVSNVSKKYCRELKKSLWYGLKDIAKEFTFRRLPDSAVSLRSDEFWALQDISFELRAGESLAIIGSNGAGKSTLLKMLYGLIRPDTGFIKIQGSVSAMIELGTGFDPILSGRENIYIRAALLGFSRESTTKLIDEIIDFAGLEEVMDTPVQYYSSGMVARLSFSVSAHLNQSILLVDEVLAVGDIDFQRKCINYMNNYISSGGALILVSHSPHHIQTVCKRGILLDKGRICFDGTAVDALDRYFEIEHNRTYLTEGDQESLLTEDHPMAIKNVSLNPLTGDEIYTGQAVKIIVDYETLKVIESTLWMFSIWTQDNAICITGAGNLIPKPLVEGAGQLHCVIPELPLLSGGYQLRIAIGEAESFQPLITKGWFDSPVEFKVNTVPSLMNNALRSINQLMTINVDWGESESKKN